MRSVRRLHHNYARQTEKVTSELKKVRGELQLFDQRVVMIEVWDRLDPFLIVPDTVVLIG